MLSANRKSEAGSDQSSINPGGAAGNIWDRAQALPQYVGMGFWEGGPQTGELGDIQSEGMWDTHVHARPLQDQPMSSDSQPQLQI